MQYREYQYTGGRGRGPTPVAPPSVPFGRGAQPPIRRWGRATIDDIHDDVTGISEQPSGVPSPQPGDNVDAYNIDPAQSPISSPPPWQAEPGDIPSPFTTPTTQVDADGNADISKQCNPLETDRDDEE